MSQIQTLTPEQTQEMAMVDLAHMIMAEASEPISFYDLLNQISSIKNMSEEELQQCMVQFYTEVNLDGRFVNVGNSNWGLKKWYPVEQFDDMTTTTPTKGKRKILDDFEDLDGFEADDEYEEAYEEEFEEDLDPIEIGFEEEEEVLEEDFIEEEDEVALDFEDEEESIEELAEEEAAEDFEDEEEI